MQRYFRGQVWWSKPPKIPIVPELTPEQRNEIFGSIQQGIRPVIIVSNNLGNRNSSTIQVVPCTTAEKTNIPTHCTLYIDGTKNTVLCEQLKTIKKTEIFNYVGMLDNNELFELDKCLKISLGLVGKDKTYTNDCELEKSLNEIKSMEDNNGKT